MTTAEAKARISTEFLTRYYEWLEDEKTLEEKAYAEKYGYRKCKSEVKDNIAGLMIFQKYIFNGRWLAGWEKAGYEKQVIWALAQEKFLSRDEDHSWMARQTGRTVFYYLSQATAKQIYKANKA